MNIEQAKTEIEDLQKFWKDITYENREAAIAAAQYYIGDFSDSGIPESLIPLKAIPESLKEQRNKLIKHIKFLKISNSKSKPSWLKQWLQKIFSEEPTINEIGCNFILARMSNGDRSNMFNYLGKEIITPIEVKTNAMMSAYKKYLLKYDGKK